MSCMILPYDVVFCAKLHDAAFGLWALLKMCVICEDVSAFMWTMNNIFHVLFFSFSLQYETELSSRIEVLLIK